MIDINEIITSNVNRTIHVLANIGIIFLIVIMVHCISPYAYFTPRFIQEFPLWILGCGIGYLAMKLFRF